MPSKIGDKAFARCECGAIWYDHIDIFWEKWPGTDTYRATCPNCQRKRRQALINDGNKRQPGLPIFVNGGGGVASGGGATCMTAARSGGSAVVPRGIQDVLMGRP